MSIQVTEFKTGIEGVEFFIVNIEGIRHVSVHENGVFKQAYTNLHLAIQAYKD